MLDPTIDYQLAQVLVMVAWRYESVLSATDSQQSEHGGWYFDDPADPNQVELCPCTGARVLRAGASVQMDYYCMLS